MSAGGRGKQDREFLRESELQEANLLGLELLVYSYVPIGFPGDVCAKVVDREI